MKRKILKIVKWTLTSLLLLIFLLIVGGYFYVQHKLKPPPNQLTVARGDAELDVLWTANEYSDRAGIYLPVRLPHIPDTFYMQFDVGAPSSILYKKAMESLIERYPNFLMAPGEQEGYIKDFTFQMDGLNVKAKSIASISYGEIIDWQDTTQARVIGTIGSDLLHRKKALIDYKNARIHLFDAMPDSISERVTLTTLQLKNRWIFFPVKIRNETKMMMWDTGASAFDLITDEATWKRLTITPNQPERHHANSWGRNIKIFSGKSNEKISIAGKELKLSTVTYTEGFPAWSKLLIKATGMNGMLGNKIFADQTIYLDLENEKFGILE